MCARRFLLAVFVLILLTVAGAVAIFQFGNRVLIKSAVPRGHFEAARAGGGPDYRRMDAWLARPGLERPDGPVQWQPASTPTPENGARPAALFYIHPTTYLAKDRWNAPFDAGGDTAFRTNLFLQSQASAFTDTAEAWAPRYRQAAYGAFLLKSRDAQRALDLAYRDVAAAFDEFVARTGDRPIILAGHSQGALQLERLLREKVAGKALAKRIAAAYVVGWPLSTNADVPALGLPACTAPDQSGCILAWMSFGNPPNAGLILDEWQKTPGLNGGERKAADVLCVDPISGIAGGTSPAAANPGTLVPSADMRSAILEPGKVGAHCDQGLLILDGDVPPLGPFMLPGNNYHVYDYALFWGAVRRDAARRVAAWR